MEIDFRDENLKEQIKDGSLVYSVGILYGCDPDDPLGANNGCRVKESFDNIYDAMESFDGMVRYYSMGEDDWLYLYSECITFEGDSHDLQLYARYAIYNDERGFVRLDEPGIIELGPSEQFRKNLWEKGVKSLPFHEQLLLLRYYTPYDFVMENGEIRIFDADDPYVFEDVVEYGDNLFGYFGDLEQNLAHDMAQ